MSAEIRNMNRNRKYLPGSEKVENIVMQLKNSPDVDDIMTDVLKHRGRDLMQRISTLMKQMDARACTDGMNGSCTISSSRKINKDR